MLQWAPEPAPTRARPARDETAANLRRFLEALSHSIGATSFAEIEAAGFHLKQITFGLGLSASGKFGIAKVAASVVGQVTLKRGGVPTPRLAISAPKAGIALIAAGTDEKLERIA